MKQNVFFLCLLFLVACGSNPSPKISEPKIQAPGFVSGADAASFTIENTSDSRLDWSISLENSEGNPQTGDWFTVSPNKGSLASKESVSITLTIKPGLMSGTYTSTLLVDYTGGQQGFDISGTVGTSVPMLKLDQENLSLLPGQTSDPIQISLVGFDTGVSLSAKRGDDGLPGGQLFVEIPKTNLAPNETTSISVKPESDAPLGNYKILIEAQTSDAAQKASITLNVAVVDGTQSSSLRGKVETTNAAIDIKAASLRRADSSLLRAPSSQQAYVPGELLIQYEASDLQRTYPERALRQRETRIKRVTERYKLTRLSRALPGQPERVLLPQGQDVLAMAEALSKDPDVRYAEPNYILQTTALPNDSQLAEQWALAAAGLPVAWELEIGSNNAVTVAVIDSGFDLEHPDLKARYVAGIDFCAVSSGNCTSGFDTDPSFGNAGNIHGTHVAGIIGAVGNNNQGIVGVSYGTKLKVVPVKIFNDQGTGATAESFVKAIRWAAGVSVSGVAKNNNPAKIINMSLGGFFDSDIVQDAIDDARDAGAILIAATGNNGLDDIMSPAAADGVIGVGSVNADFRRSCFSNYASATRGPGKLDIVAPGGDGPAFNNSISKPKPSCDPGIQGVISTLTNNRYGIQAGTSMATPMVAGVAALLLSQDPSLSPSALEAKLLNATFYDASYMSAREYGAGVLRAELAFGLPGPGESVSISAKSKEDSAVDTVTLDLYGGSDRFTLAGLKPGSYTLEAVASGTSRSLKATKTLTLGSGQSNQTLSLEVK